MSHLLMFTSDIDGVARPNPLNRSLSPKENMWDRALHRIGGWLKKEDGEEAVPEQREREQEQCSQLQQADSRPSSPRRLSRVAVPSLPRPITFRRQNSERRDRLTPHEPFVEERRALSVDRRASASGTRTLSPPFRSVPSSSAPDLHDSHQSIFRDLDRGIRDKDTQCSILGENDVLEDVAPEIPLDPPWLPPATEAFEPLDDLSEGVDDHIVREEADAKWILNLSMHFRDGSDREKFFVTYAEQPNRWRRVTVSCDYRGVPDDSLEADLKTLHYQRDKSFKIYESIRDSLQQIQFYPTVTNLKLQTSDGRLHVHVTEDVNEIIPYPPVSMLRHIAGPRLRESSLQFESHMSGFVYQVRVNGTRYIKKEIPGPDAVEEFVYEINALSSLQEAASVIHFEGIIVDDNCELIKGLLVGFAEEGALVDIIYDLKTTGLLPWTRRERWAKQIVQGLSEIHEGGFVQGDFTLSNIVVDANDDAKIIDINRRGCPIGWEPPELKRMIQSGQRISLYIGTKSDVYQLGMVLWALATLEDEPERQDRPLTCALMGHEVPQYYRDLVLGCLEDEPRRRPSPNHLLLAFPMIDAGADPVNTINLQDIDTDRQQRAATHRSDFSVIDFDDTATSSEYPFESAASCLDARRDRSPGPRALRQHQYSPYESPSTNPSLCDSDMDHEVVPLPPSHEPPWNAGQSTVDTSLREQPYALELDDRHSSPQPTSNSVPVAPTSHPSDAAFAASDTCEPDRPSGRTLRAGRGASPSPAHHSTRTPLVQRSPHRSPATASVVSEDHAADGSHALPPPAPRQQTPAFGPPLHQDSGFDEAALDALGAGAARAPG